MRRALHFGSLVAILSLVCCSVACGQSGFVQVQGQILDPNNIAYSSCQMTVSYVPSPSATTIPTISGSAFPTSYPAFTCDSFGNIPPLALPDNNLIQDGHTSSPASLWRFNVCSAPGRYPGPQYCFNTALTITGGTQNVTSALQAAAAILPSSSGGGNVSNSGTPTAAQIAIWVDATHIKGVSLLPITSGGTGTSTPSLQAGSGIGISGIWPNQTVTYTGGGGGGCPGGTGTNLQFRGGSSTCSGASGSSVDLAGDITVGASLSIVGPAPWIDVTAGGKFFASTSTADFTCSSGLNTITLSGGAGDFAIGNTIQLSGCGAATASSAPSSLTGTPVGGTASTHYTYYVSGVSALQSDTPYTSVAITTGEASLNIAQYNQICWADDPTVVGHDVWVGATAGAAIFIGYTGDDCFNDYGYTHTGERAGAAPTHPSASATSSILEAAINNISGLTWTLSVNAGANNSSAIMAHDGNPEIAAAIATISAGGSGGTIYFPVSASSNTYEVAGNNILSADNVHMLVDAGMYVQGANSEPVWQEAAASHLHFYVDGGNWPEKILNVTPDGVMDFPNFHNTNFTGCCGGVGVYGQTYSAVFDTINIATVYHAFDWGQSSFESNTQINNVWAQSNQCAVLFSSSEQVHDLNISNTILEGWGTQTCPQEGDITFAGNSLTPTVDRMTWTNVVTSDFAPVTAAPIVLIQYGTVANWGCYTCDLANTNGEIVKTTGLGGGAGNGLWGPAEFHASVLDSNTNIFTGTPCSVLIEGSTLTGTFPPTGVSGCVQPILSQSSLNGVTIAYQALPNVFATYHTCAAAEIGQQASVSDSTTEAWGATITGGGSLYAFGVCDGTNWTVVGK